MEHTDAPLTPPRDPRVAPPPMTNAEIHQWIDACNHEPARQVLRSIVGLREEKFDIVPMGEIRHLKGQINTLAAKIESNAKVIAALREALETVKIYIADHMIAHAIVVPADAAPNEKGRFNPMFPSLMQIVDRALAATNEQTAGEK